MNFNQFPPITTTTLQQPDWNVVAQALRTLSQAFLDAGPMIENFQSEMARVTLLAEQATASILELKEETTASLLKMREENTANMLEFQGKLDLALRRLETKVDRK